MRPLYLLSFAVLAACSNPDAATEAPVQMQPGLYELTLGGSTMVTLKSEGRKGEVCLTSYDASEFPKDPLERVAEPWEDCSTQVDPPRGNTMSGARQCKDRKTPMTATYTGSHTTDSFEIKGEVSQGSDENASVMRLGSGDFSIVGKRVGDCSL